MYVSGGIVGAGGGLGAAGVAGLAAGSAGCGSFSLTGSRLYRPPGSACAVATRVSANRPAPRSAREVDIHESFSGRCGCGRGDAPGQADAGCNRGDTTYL